MKYLIFVFLCLTSNLLADESKIKEYKGVLHNRVFAIGGETIGIVLTVNKENGYELLLDKTDKKMQELVDKLDGKSVVVTGELKEIKGIEIPTRRIIKVKTVKPAS